MSCRAWEGRHALASQAADPEPFPELGKADTRSGKGSGSTACETAPERLFRKGGKGARRTQHHRAPGWTNSASPSTGPPVARTPPDVERLRTRPATCAVRVVGREPMAASVGSRFRPTSRAGAEAKAVDPVVLPERVSAFPGSGRTTGSTACNSRLSAFPIATGHIGPDAPTHSCCNARGSQVSSSSMIRS